METKLRLNPGEILKLTDHRNKGSLAETDIDFYAIVNESGTGVGSVEHTNRTSINGLKRSQHVIQRDNTGNVIVEERW
ncbi:hypothetical protein C8R34_12310 [Nitrosomonas sp. Nm84]|uniref:hypothetical protein n=1 Tax=Nitrosomonas sp. Nm84 TaxID=200124 RepID=UPI000D76B411|nr:hypothetical protein [Nitrosomonas sp. Nm84]PXW84921.1 hypothetical protein C8R34_12310 [Nitrosomonas sp. Nm84]